MAKQAQIAAAPVIVFAHCLLLRRTVAPDNTILVDYPEHMPPSKVCGHCPRDCHALKKLSRPLPTPTTTPASTA